MKKIFLIGMCAWMCCAQPIEGQNRLTREQILSMTTDELSDLPLEDLMAAVETLGVSSVDELFYLIMNKNVSSASKREESSFTSPLATTVITQEEIRSYGCSTIEEAFRLIPGMIVTQKTNGVYDVQLRGLNNIPDNNMLLYTENNNTLLMVDGRVLHNYSIGAMSAENLPIGIGDVERIEVVRGACSALYGVNAVNGVINIITRKPADAPAAVSGSYQMGNQGTYVADVAFRKAFSPKVATGVTFNMQYRERPTDKLRTFIDDKGSMHFIDRDGVLETGLVSMYSLEQIQQLENEGKLVRVGANEQISIDDMNHLKEVRVSDALSLGGSTVYSAFRTVPEEYADAHKLFRDPKLARKTLGVNGYLSLTPNPGVRFDITGGYSQNMVTSTTLLINPYSYNVRMLKKGYFNANADIRGLHLQANYSAGPEDYAQGRPGFQVKTQQVFASADYDFTFGDVASWGELDVRPGVSYQYLYSYDVYSTYDYGGDKGEQRLSGFFNGDAELWSLAPSLRLDYEKGRFRAILALRSDKTHIPDKWNTSFQAAANYKISDRNFVRFVYGRGIRSANLVNTSVSYMWRREGLNVPSEIQFLGNKDANLMMADNYEVGYRLQPTHRLLIDAEGFYSRSKNYGSLMAARSELTISDASIMRIYQSSGGGNIDLSDPAQASMVQQLLIRAVGNGDIMARNYTEYDNLPYRVHQIGFGVNVDWVITPKLVAKLNANIQRTWIDNYYPYSQLDNIANQLGACTIGAMNTFPDVVGTMLGYEYKGGTTFEKVETSRTPVDFVQAVSHPASVSSVQEMYSSLSPAEQEAFTTRLRQGWWDGQDNVTIDGTTYDNALSLYYSLKYNLRKRGSENVMGESESIAPKLENGHKHKSTPSVYGMFGLVYKPTDYLDISAYGNLVGKRTLLTMYGETELDPRFTLNLKVGYKPVENCEVFLNANNLFNTKKQEFAYSDEIGGIYTIGLNFEF